MNYRIWISIMLICANLSAPAMDYSQNLYAQSDYDEDVARAIQLSLEDQYSQPNLADTANDYEIALQIYCQDIESQAKVHQKIPVPVVNKQSQQGLDADYALALELSMQDGAPVIHRALRKVMYQPRRQLDPVEQKRRERATKIAIEQHLSGPVVQYPQFVIQSWHEPALILPRSIRALPVDAQQLTVIRQHEMGTCGSRSVANALALRDVVTQGLAINSLNVCNMAKKYESLHTKNGVSSREQIQIAQHFGLHNTYAIGFYQMNPISNTEINRYPFTVIDSTEIGAVNLYQESEILEDIVRTIRNQKNIVANFLCHLAGTADRAGHSVVVSIVKCERQPTKMIYMDSNNVPVADHSQAAAYICYLYWQCVA